MNVEGNGEFSEINSIVIGRIGIVDHQTHQSFKDGKFTINIKTSQWMTPLCHLIVYYIHPSGEIVYDMIKIEFATPLPNTVIMT